VPALNSMVDRAASQQDPCHGLVERQEGGLTILSPANVRPIRRILYVNSYGGRAVLDKIKKRAMPPQHLWGCLELARMGYEVALAEPLPYFYFRRHPIPHDLKFFKFARNWLRPDGILFAGHTVLYWLSLFRKFGAFRPRIVSLKFGREELDFSNAHSGIIGMTPAAAEHARQMAPKAKVAHIAWGVDLDFFPQLPYQPSSFLSCGITNRDHRTLCDAAIKTRLPIRLISPGTQPGLNWPTNVTLVDSGSGWNFEEKRITYTELLHDYYAASSGSLIILKKDPDEYTANGFTNLLEAMAMSRPVIFTRTGAAPGEIDVEKAGCGLHVPPENACALAEAIDFLHRDKHRATEMGKVGHNLCKSHYNIRRFACDLHTFFEAL
jgi:glycosyltransferase involved in cell wall biosynthesis